jgi:hypothetical protein
MTHVVCGGGLCNVCGRNLCYLYSIDKAVENEKVYEKSVLSYVKYNLHMKY